MERILRKILLAAVVCAMLLSPQRAAAQATAAITGTVSDESGAIIPGTTITITNAGTGLNHPSFAAPDTTTRRIFDAAGRLAGSPGQLSRTTTLSRQAQFGLKYIF